MTVGCAVVQFFLTENIRPRLARTIHFTGDFGNTIIYYGRTQQGSSTVNTRRRTEEK